MLVCAAGDLRRRRLVRVRSTRTLQVEGARYTDPRRGRAGPRRRRAAQNLFGLSTAPLRGRARVAADRPRGAGRRRACPDTLAVTHRGARRRSWSGRSGTRRYLADADGTLFALLPDQPPARRRGLPVIDDQRADVGQPRCRARRSIRSTSTRRPASPRSSRPTSAARRPRWRVSVTDANGFVVATRPSGWSAVFGFYTPSLRTTELIPDQVRLLRSLLVGREAQVDRVILASGTDGTYIAATPEPTGQSPIAQAEQGAVRWRSGAAVG